MATSWITKKGSKRQVPVPVVFLQIHSPSWKWNPKLMVSKKTSYSRVPFSSSILNFGTVLFHFLLTSKWSTIFSRSQGAIRNHPKDMRQHLPCFHSLWKKSMITTSWWLNHPSEKYACQIGSFPQVGVQNNIWNHHLDKISPQNTPLTWNSNPPSQGFQSPAGWDVSFA